MAKVQKATFDHCCCCIELRCGCFILGYSELIGFIFIFAKLIEVWIKLGDMIALLKDLMKLSDEEFKEVGRVARAFVLGLIIVMVLLSALKIFFTIIMLIGLHKNKRGHVGAYLLYSAIFWLLNIIFLISGIVKYATYDFSKFHLREEEEMWIRGQFIGQFIAISVAYVLFIYFWMVIRSQYHEMPINCPKKPNNPVDARPSPIISNVRPEGPTSQFSDEASRGTKANNSEKCTAPTDDGRSTLPASSDVRPEGQESQLSDEVIQGTSMEIHLKQSTFSENIEPADSPASLNVQPEEPTSQNSDEGSRDTNMADNSRQFASPVDLLPSTLSVPHHSFAAASRGKTESGEFCEIELLPLPATGKK